MEIRPVSADVTQRPLQQISSSTALSDGSPTSDQGMDEQEAIPKLELQIPERSSILLQTDHRSAITIQCKRFNRYAQYLGANASPHQPTKSANAVRDTLAEIEKILEQASNSIREKTAQLDGNVKQFSLDVSKHADATWYRRVEDITTLDGIELYATFKEMPAVNVDDFVRYLRKSLPAAAKNGTPGIDMSTYSFSFCAKVITILDYLMNQVREDYSPMMKLCTTVRARVFIPGRPRESARRFMKRSQLIDHRLMMVLSKHSTEPDSDDYWDFAASWRELVDGWEEAILHKEANTGAFLQLLSNYRTKAHWEVRRRVNIAIGGRLPTELEDAIFEEAMLAEEIPLQD